MNEKHIRLRRKKGMWESDTTEASRHPSLHLLFLCFFSTAHCVCLNRAPATILRQLIDEA
ncbi:hypothetical protein CAEBREN_28989 [Caenorhabditis brenneri]|uniref:Uncharacterized protein n=1 Tax=Caenorhabditis brenneri TaxID=135651 RepID=G0M7W5_CAEBE|nr:hypothetical protein CAEBREN_28989 [Caenorhabditis brenneri]